jgi:Delta7-sterol 5-desaturase
VGCSARLVPGSNVNAVLDWLRALTPAQALALCAAQNLGVFLAALAFGALCLRQAPGRATRRELQLAAATVAVNTLITCAGWALWRDGHLQVRHAGVARSLLDALTLLLLMDACMYVLHRAAHLPFFYRRVHHLHHVYEAPSPLTLFVMHPLESLGFGLLWLGLLWVHSATWLGMTLYLTLNVAFGVVGHLGREPLPLPRPLQRWLGTAGFHGLHHRSPHHNYGFYTQLWDRLLHTAGAEPATPRALRAVPAAPPPTTPSSRW